MIIELYRNQSNFLYFMFVVMSDVENHFFKVDTIAQR